MKYTVFNEQFFGYDEDQISLFNQRIAEGHVEVFEEALPKQGQSEDNRDFKHFTGRDKQGIFTEAEKRAIYSAAYKGPDNDIDVLLLVKEMDNAEYVTYSDQSMVQGLEILEVKGLITPERHQEIIAVMTAERN